MMDWPNQSSFWDGFYQKRLAAKETKKPPSEFALRCLPLMKNLGVHSILELGCGVGDDAICFANNDFKVTGIDFSSDAVLEATKKAEALSAGKVSFEVHDYTQPLRFSDGSFDCVYAHLSLHYFDDPTTSRIFSEVNRVLRENGLFVACVRSVQDPKCGTGQEIGTDTYLQNGHIGRFFTRESLQDKLHQFVTLELEHVNVQQTGWLAGTEGCLWCFRALKKGHEDTRN